MATANARAGSAHGGIDVLESLAGAIQQLAMTAAIRREIATLKPRIAKDVTRSRGVLLVVRVESSGLGGAVRRLAGVAYGGPGGSAEEAVHRWQVSPHLFPGAGGQVSETFLWVVKKADLSRSARRPAGYYPALSGAADVRVLCWESDVAPLG